MVLTSSAGPCVSTTNGIVYTCHKVPYKYGQTGRYSSAPSANVIYHTAGTWPSKAPSRDKFELSRNIRLVKKQDKIAYEVGASPIRGDDPNATYTAELWKSSDGGKTWKN